MVLKTLRPVALAGALALAAACSGDKKGAAPSGPPPGTQKVDPAKAGSLAGRVLLDGPAPANAPIKMSADPFCIRANADGSTIETYKVDNGGLENVFVYVKDGLGNYSSTRRPSR